jgi:flagellar biosynthesis/type III secretory pathway M-ring protein FliF/YscJ
MDDTLMWILIAVAVLVVLFLIYWFVAGKNRRLEQRRETAAEHREEAQLAAQRAGEADLTARRQQEAAEAERERALELQRKAEKVDPDR